MTHLTFDELVDALEGTLGTDRARHLDACADCRDQLTALRTTVTDTAAVDVPEPSPLFWDHFSQRVRAAIDQTPRPLAPWWRRPAFGLACAAMAALLIVVVFRMTASRQQPAVQVVATDPTEPATDHTPRATDHTDPVSTPSNDPVWALLRAAASDMQLNEAHAAGLNVRPASVDDAVGDLTPLERTELERLIRAELKRAGA
jgi:hypothetical protein